MAVSRGPGSRDGVLGSIIVGIGVTQQAGSLLLGRRPSGMSDSGYASPLGRQDQVLVAALVLAALLAMAVYWLRAGGHRGQLVDIDQAAPTSARIHGGHQQGDLAGIGAAAGHRRDTGAAGCQSRSWTDLFATRVICGEFRAWDPNCWSVSNHFCCPSGQAAIQGPRRGQVTVRFQLVSPFSARRRSAPGHRGPDPTGLRARPEAPGADGRDRLGQDVHHGQRHPGRAAADAGHVAQQDAGRPALRRVQGVLSAQRRPLLRQLLRLLPARGVHPAARHLHREGRLDQPADRPAAAGRHQRAGEPPRRDHRGQRLVHLRPRLARGLPRDDGRPGAWARRSTATRCSPSWSISSTSGTTSSSSRASSASAAIASRSGRRYEEYRLPHRVLGRRGRAAFDHQSHQRRGDRAASSSCSSTRPSTS